MTFDYIDPFHISEIVDQTTVTQNFYIATATVLVYDSCMYHLYPPHQLLTFLLIQPLITFPSAFDGQGSRFT